MKRNIVNLSILLGIIIVVGVVGGVHVMFCHRVPKQIHHLWGVSPRGQDLAMTVEPYPMDPLRPRPANLVMLMLGKNGVLQVPFDSLRPIFAMSWRPTHLVPELYVALAPYGSASARIVGLKVTKEISEIFSQNLPKETFINGLAWNPAGDVMACCLCDPYARTFLSFSYDAGRNFDITTIRCSPYQLVWADDHTMYIVDEYDLLELAVADRTAFVKRNVAVGKHIKLGGVLADKVCFTKDNEVYRDDELFYRSSHDIIMLVANGEYAAFKEQDAIIVLDESGDILNKMSLQAGSIIRDIVLDQDRLYYVENRKYIKRWNFLRDHEASTVYDIGQ